MRKHLPALLFIMLLTSTGLAGSIKSWNSADVLLSSDLNGNFQHIHNTMVGGHGARLVNADVSASAAIAYSKMQSHFVVPKLVAAVNCTSSVCSVTNQSSVYVSGINITSVGNITGTGPWTMAVTLSATLSNATYWPVVVRTSVANATEPVYCQVQGAPTTSSFVVTCNGAGGSLTTVNWVVMLYDDDI